MKAPDGPSAVAVASMSCCWVATGNSAQGRPLITTSAVDSAFVQPLPQVHGVLLDHVGLRVAVAQTRCQVRIDLDGQVPAAAAESALDLCGESRFPGAFQGSWG